MMATQKPQRRPPSVTSWHRPSTHASSSDLRSSGEGCFHRNADQVEGGSVPKCETSCAWGYRLGAIASHLEELVRPQRLVKENGRKRITAKQNLKSMGLILRGRKVPVNRRGSSIKTSTGCLPSSAYFSSLLPLTPSKMRGR